jgi:putative ABC transport system ATP-binding protein
MNVIELRNVSKRFRLGAVDLQALRDVNLSIAKGEFAAITGPSGSGKSTLLNLIGCLDVPTSGEVVVNGSSTRSLRERDLDAMRSRAIGFVFQTFNLIPVLTALENVVVPLHLHRLRRREMIDRAKEALAVVGLADHARHLPDQLSGGQRQRVSIARALVTRPSIVLADEPTANLDSANAASIIELMRSLNEKQSVTFLFSTHDPALLAKVPRVVRLRDGAILSEGDAAPAAISHRRAERDAGRIAGTAS